MGYKLQETMNNHGPQRFEVTQHRENDNRYLKKKKIQRVVFPYANL